MGRRRNLVDTSGVCELPRRWRDAGAVLTHTLRKGEVLRCLVRGEVDDAPALIAVSDERLLVLLREPCRLHRAPSRRVIAAVEPLRRGVLVHTSATSFALRLSGRATAELLDALGSAGGASPTGGYVDPVTATTGWTAADSVRPVA